MVLATNERDTLSVWFVFLLSLYLYLYFIYILFILLNHPPQKQTYNSFKGMMMNNPKLNPLTYDWNKVLIPYCDGGSFAGNNESVSYVDVRGKMMPLYFRGFRNLNAVLDDLVANHGLGDVTDALVSGDSAGGLASYWHVDATCVCGVCVCCVCLSLWLPLCLCASVFVRVCVRAWLCVCVVELEATDGVFR